MAFEVNLKPQYDSRKSFYGKAKVESDENGNKTLYSYGTKVAEIRNGKPIVFGLYSTTTTRHIKDFLMQNGFDFKDSKDILVRYGETEQSKKEDNERTDSSFKTIGNVASLGEIFADNEKDKNTWKLRMIKAGLGESFQLPDDWESLSEKEKGKRLDLVIKTLKKEE